MVDNTMYLPVTIGSTAISVVFFVLALKEWFKACFNETVSYRRHTFIAAFYLGIALLFSSLA